MPLFVQAEALFHHDNALSQTSSDVAADVHE